MDMMKLIELGKMLDIAWFLSSFLYSGMFAALAKYWTYLESGFVALTCDWVILLISYVL